MHVSQSAMSHTLARLRDTFADPLFVRTARGLEPTARALALSPKLNAVLDEIGELLAPEVFNPVEINTRFRLQTHSFIAASYLAPFFNEMHRLAPNLIFDSHGLSEYSYQQLDKGNVDLIIAGGIEALPRFMQRGIMEEDRVCLVDKNHPGIKTWSRDTFLRYPHMKNTLIDDKDDPVPQALRIQDLPVRQVGFYTDDLLVQAVVLKGSELIATLPRSVAEIGKRLYGHVILPCPIETPTVTIKAIWHERSQNEQVHCWIRDQLAAMTSGE